MQFDTGDIQSIVGVVTQGRRDREEWVTEFRVDVSVDGNEWLAVGCQRVFEGNTDKNTKVDTLFREPVRARYLRIYPMEWHEYPSMRAGALVCERPCQGGQLDYPMQLTLTSITKGPSLDPNWGEGEYKEIANEGGMPKYAYEFEAGQGLELDQGVCLHGSTAWTILIEAKLEITKGYRRVLGSDGWGDYGLYVNKQLMLTPRSAKMKCAELIRTDKFYKFIMTRTADGTVSLYINGDLCASGSPPYKNHFQLAPNSTTFFQDENGENTGGQLKDIHVWDRALSADEIAEVCACKLTDDGEPCKLTVVFNPPTSKTTFSSTKNGDAVGEGYGSGRLNSRKAWVPGANIQGEYMQIDLGVAQTVAGVVTQGRKDDEQWVTSFKVTASVDGKDWRDVGCGRQFEANTNRNAKRQNLFTRPVHAQYVRIYPMTWHDAPAMRAGLVLCEQPCTDGMLDYHMDNTFASRSGGPSLDPAWGDGTFEDDAVTGDAYLFSAGQGMCHFVLCVYVYLVSIFVL
jgi:hypothetical protein